MGTIIRAADWFGFDNIFIAQHSAEIWNPKVIQAAMGSVFRIPVQVIDTLQFLESVKGRQPVYGMLLDGMPIEQIRFTEPGIVIIGNESRGISPELLTHISYRITIQGAVPDGQGRAESLNASLATAIVCYEISRQINIGK
jgi:TrmH family RNA methyltransferase